MLLMWQLLEAYLRNASIGRVGAPALAIKTDGADTTNTNALPVNGRRDKGVTAAAHHCVGHAAWRTHEDLSDRALAVASPIRTDGRRVCDVACA
jgi:hypothetical protein